MIFYLKEIDCRIIAVWDVVSIQWILVKIHQRITAIYFRSLGCWIWASKSVQVLWLRHLISKNSFIIFAVIMGIFFGIEYWLMCQKEVTTSIHNLKISLRFRFGSCSRQRFRISLNTTWWSSARKHNKIELYSFPWFFVLTLYICIFEHSFVIYTSIIHITKPKHLIFINVAPGA